MKPKSKGDGSTVKKLAADVTEAEAPPVAKAMVTVFAPALTASIRSFKEFVLVPITQVPTELALVSLQVADASCDEEMKFEPVTVMVLPV